jgi:putative membrane protein
MRRFPHILAALYVAWFAVLAEHPVSRQVWLAEALPAGLLFLFLVLTFPRFRFSNLAYGLMSFWLFWHTLGAHYTFALVPFGWITDLFGFTRNNFDRVAHFGVGLFAYPVLEYVTRRRQARTRAAYVLALACVMAVAAGYEIVEWAFAALAGGDAGPAFLGTQGDPWDPQKDMLADTLGALCALLLFRLAGPRPAKA